MYSIEDQSSLIDLSEKLSMNPDELLDANPEFTVKLLKKLIQFHDWNYYVASSPVISDYDYDVLFSALKKIEEKNPSLITPDSPTQRVARGLSENFPTVQHLIPMLSLDNSYNKSDLDEWSQRLLKASNSTNIQLCVEPKYDGSSIALVYENDILIRAATRGNGIEGDEITNNAKVLRSIPLSAKFSSFGIHRVELRGEVVINKIFFDEMNEERIKQGLDIFQNARNTASGALRMKDSKEVAKRGLEAIIYQISVAEDKDGNSLIGSQIETHQECIEILYRIGFHTIYNDHKICTSISDVIDYCEEWENKRNKFQYEIDGMVVKANSFEIQKLSGETAHHPRWAIAYKFKARQAKTKLLDIQYQVGRTGAVTPVAKLKPVPLSGVTISSVSLHNEEFIKQKNLMLGDTIIVERAGDVIPYIVGAVSENRNGGEKEIIFPRSCPSCSAELIKLEEEAVWRCINIDCPAQIEERMIHFVSKGAMNIDGLGKDIIKRFIKEQLLQHLQDIYKLDYEKILTLEGWKTKSVENLKKGIQNSKSQPYWRLLVGLGIRHVGTQTAKTLAAHFSNIHQIATTDEETLLNLPDVGPKVAESIFDFFKNESNKALIGELDLLGVNVKSSDENKLESNVLDGKSFLFTGTLQKLSRDEAKELVEKNGGKTISAISSKLDYLVTGEKAGSKLDKAKQISTIQIIDEDAFLSMIGQN